MPDDDALDALTALRASVVDAAPETARLEWRRRRQLHMTLRYLYGGLPADPGPLYAGMAAIAARTRRIDLVFDRVEAWSNVLVACPAPHSRLDGLFADADAVAVACGDRPEPKPPKPHVTLAYLPRAPGALPGTGLPRAPSPLPFETCVGRVALARTAPGGYETPDWWPLQDPPLPTSPD
nr:2'-5' RNA ligase family protein [Luteimonas salinisoli]